MPGILLPPNSTLWERCVAEAVAFGPVVVESINDITSAKLVTRPATFLPFLVDEYGLGELTPYVPNLYDLIGDGIKWQRIRGSVTSIKMGLGWIGYSADYAAAWTGRNWWNSYQLYFDRLPVNDAPDFERIEGIVTLSECLRSDFRRGVCQYDAPALEGDETIPDEAIGDNESGIIVSSAGTIWSFGRTQEIDHLLTKAEGESIGNWLEPVSEPIKWINMPYPWLTANFPWESAGEPARQMLMAEWFNRRLIYMAFYNADENVIGYRRCRAVHSVTHDLAGVFQVGSRRFSPSHAGPQVYIEAMTDFIDADSITAASVSLIVHALPAEHVPAGRLWLAPDEITGGVEIIKTPVSIALRKTVREQVKILVRFS